MPKLDSNLYGADDTGYASRVWSDGLSTSKGDEDIWGDFQDARSMAKGNVGSESLGPSDPKVPTLKGNMAGGGDKESLLNPYPQLQRFPRHTKGPSTSKDEGGGITQPMPRNQAATRKGGSPKP